MTETWQTSTEPDELAGLLVGLSRRKALLLGVACLKRIPEGDSFSEARDAVRTAESWADGLIPDAVVQAAYRAVFNRRESAGRMILGDPDSDEPHPGTAMYYAIEATIALLDLLPPTEVILATLTNCRQTILYGKRSGREKRIRAEAEAQCSIIRDVFGNPFRPIAFDPTWRTEAVVALARGMYEGRDFAAMPVLADALDDAGCDHPGVLAHCRGAGPHVRGCWVVDLVLGKA